MDDKWKVTRMSLQGLDEWSRTMWVAIGKDDPALARCVVGQLRAHVDCLVENAMHVE